MPVEYQLLAFMTFFFLFAWLPVSLSKGLTFGTKWLTSNRDTIPNKPLPLWGQRADRAYNNLKDYFPAFVVAILLLGATHKFDHSTTVAASLYVAGRIGHYISYSIGNFAGRFLTFLVAMASNVFLLIKIFI